MNSYELRHFHRQQVVKALRDIRSFAKALDYAGVQRFYEEGYRALYDKEPDVKLKGGWFFVKGKRVSKSGLLQMGRVLWSKLHEQELNNDAPNS